MTESMAPKYSPFDHAPRFLAISENEAEIAARLGRLLAKSEPQPVDVDDRGGHILLSAEVISHLWGLFPASARSRAVPNPPVIRSDAPRWFASDSNPTELKITDKAEEAISPTSHGLANMDTETEVITVHEIPDNGFSDGTKRIVQAGVVVHEFAHSVVNHEIYNHNPEYSLVFPDGSSVPIRNWISNFALTAEKYPPVSHYSSAYRQNDGFFPRVDGALTGVDEELVELINAELLGYIVSPIGLTFEPFKGREELREFVRNYLAASLQKA